MALGALLRRSWAHPVVGRLLRLALAYVVIIEVGVQVVFGQLGLPFTDATVGLQPRPVPRGLFLVGAVIGGLYALMAVGLILVYRANRVINFAQAQLGAVAGVAGVLLIAAHDWPYVLVLPLALLGGGLTGAAVEVGVVRRFTRSSRLVLTVATVGIGFLLLVAEFLVKQALAGGDLLRYVADLPTPFGGFDLRLGVVTVSGDHFVTLLVTAGALLALVALFRRTRIGIAIRAAAQNRDRASLLGIPVDRVSTVVWTLAGVLSAIGVFLRAPLVGLPLGGFVGPLFLLYGLTAAAIGRMRDLPIAVTAGLFVGIADVASVFATNRSSLATATMVGVILVALLFQRRGEGARPGRAEAASWQTVRDLRPIPLELRGVTEVRWGRRVLIAAGVVLAVAMPWVLGDLRIGFATIAVIYAIVGVSLVVLTGWTGEISLGQFGIAGVGAAVAGGLSANLQADFFVTLLVAGIAGAAVALLLGLPALRIRGMFLAVATLAFSFTVAFLVLDDRYFGWLLPEGLGFVERPVLWGRLDLTADSQLLGITVTADAKFYLLCLAFLAVIMAAARSLRRYRSGRVLIGVRDNDAMMQSFGVGPAATRLAAFAMSGFAAALAGALLAYQQGAVDAEAFLPQESIQLFVMTVIGGITSVGGAVLGAVFLQALPVLGLNGIPVVGPVITILGTGLGILLILYFLPGGLAEGVQRLRDRALRWVADRRGLVVPSLLADRRVSEGDGPEDVRAILEDASEREVAAPGGSRAPARAPTPRPAGGEAT